MDEEEIITAEMAYSVQISEKNVMMEILSTEMAVASVSVTVEVVIAVEMDI